MDWEQVGSGLIFCWVGGAWVVIITWMLRRRREEAASDRHGTFEYDGPQLPTWFLSDGYLRFSRVMSVLFVIVGVAMVLGACIEGAAHLLT